MAATQTPPQSLASSILSSFSTAADQLDATELRSNNGGDIPRNNHIHHGFITRVWRNHITVIVPGAHARDHLALERTYLSYNRTSLALSLISVIIAQLQILQHAPNPNPHFGFFILGKPLAVILVVCSIIISLLGFVRWWKWQRTLLRGKAISGGWELSVVGIIVFLVLFSFFGLAMAVDIKKTYF